jgi:2'-5' RNA ligase
MEGTERETAGSLRLFVAVDLPEGVRAGIRALQDGLPAVRWTPVEQLHLTLRFIGATDRDRFRRMKEVLALVSCRQFSLEVRGVGRFPPGGPPRILWVGLAETEMLARLHREVELALAGAGLAPEGRRFSPHITVARVKEPNRVAVAAWLERHGGFTTPPFPVEEFHLYSSILSSGGATHRREASWRLLRASS